MAEEIGFKLTAEDGVSDKVKGIKAQLKEAQYEVVILSQKFGATSKEAVEAAKRTAQLRDRIADAKQLSDAFHPDEKFRALGAAIQATAGGFAAIQGAQALFGSSSEALEKTLIKVQAAMALTQGVNAVIGNIEAFKNLALVIKGNVIKAVNLLKISFSTLKGAIAATGIGVLIIAAGVLVSKLMEMTEGTDDAAKAQDKLKKATDELTESFNNQISLSERLHKLRMSQLKSQGASVGDLAKQERKNYLDKISIAETALQDAKAKGLNELDFLNKLQSEKDNLKIYDNEQTSDKLEENRKIVKSNNDKLKEQRIQESKELKELEKQLAFDVTKIGKDEFEIRRIDLNKWYEDQKKILKNNQESLINLNRIYRGKEKEITDEEDKKQEEINAEKQKAKEEKQQAQLEGSMAKINAAIKRQADANLASIADEEATAAAKKRIDEGVVATKKQTQDALLGALSTFSNLAGRQTAFGKTLAVADATINTYLAASQVLSSKSPLFIINPFARFVAAAATIANGLMNVRNILKVQVPGGGGGGATPSTPSAPAIPQPLQQTTRIDQQQVNQIGNATVRAFVVEADMTNNQEKVRRLNRAARLG